VIRINEERLWFNAPRPGPTYRCIWGDGTGYTSPPMKGSYTFAYVFGLASIASKTFVELPVLKDNA
jgi:hypothetical protein